MPLDPIRVKALFNAALDLADPVDRSAFLDRECGDARELRQRLGDLLAAYDQPAVALERPLGENVGQTTAREGAPISAEQPASSADETSDGSDQTSSYRPETAPPAELIGSMIAGRYKLREEIGEGGMGSVYLAEQLQPVKRRVALKLIKAGMDSRTVLARFESERQALALMDHPNIAKVLDAGTTENGRPFFVMELVKGIPLTGYCDQHRLGLLERLALFRQICSAVQHAHQKGIIHRDLKPTNILVESHDGSPVPRVIDFGLAKATSGLQLTEQSLYSAFGTVAGTPLYMAPEQATFNAIDVDTRADVYALGVILYELLTGTTPIDRQTFQKAAIDEMLRMVREIEPPTPSRRLSTSDTLPSLAATRQTEPSRLGRFMRGDLDWIVMKALAKERQRRYESPIAFSQDIERFLNHEPVSAGPPTSAYRFTKFVRRNRPQVIAASLVLLALLVGIIGTTLGLIEARRQQRIATAESVKKEEARQAEADQRKKAVEAERLAHAEADKALAINEFLSKDLLTQAEPSNNAAEDKVTLLEVLDRAAGTVGTRFADQPDIGVSLRKTIAKTYHGLAAWPKAETQWRAVLEAERQTNRESAASFLAQSELCHILRHRGQHDADSLALAKEAAEGLGRTLGRDHPDTLESMDNLGMANYDAGKLDLATAIFEQTLELRKSKLGPDHTDTLASIGNLAMAYWAAHRLDRSIPLFEEALKVEKIKSGENHPDTLKLKANLGVNYTSAGRLAEALALLEETLTQRKSKLGVDHPDTLMNLVNLADCYQAGGKLDRALPLYEQALALRRSKLGPDHPATLLSMNRVAEAYVNAGKLDRAVPLFEESLALIKARFGAVHAEVASQALYMAGIYATTGRLQQALPLLEDASRAVRANPGLRYLRGQILDTYIKVGQNDQAAALAKEMLMEGRAKLPAGSLQLAGMMVQVGFALLKIKAPAEAEPVLREALAIRGAREPDAWTTFNTKSMVGAALLGQKKYAESEPLLKVAYAGMKQRAAKIPPEAKFRLTEAIDRLIELAEMTGKAEDAKNWKDEKAKMEKK